MRGLYPIVDVDSLTELSRANGSIVEFATRVLVVRPPLLQLRAKHSSARDTLALLRALRPLCTAAGTRLIANDRADLAVLGQCDGVHMGQDDLPLALVRSIAPGLVVGVSTHTLSELGEALAERPDYVAFGPVFGTGSKEQPAKTVGLDLLGEAHARARAAGIPLVAIGGITIERAPAVATRCDLAAVIAALQPDRTTLVGVREAAWALQNAFTAAQG